MRRSTLMALSILSSSSAFGLEDVAGRYQTLLGDIRATVILEPVEDGLSGRISAQGYEYIIMCSADGDSDESPADSTCAGVLYDPQIQTSAYLEVGQDAQGPFMAAYLSGDLNPPTLLRLQAMDPTPSAPTPPAAEDEQAGRDALLVGRWTSSGSHTSGEFTAAWRNEMTFHADGTLEIHEGEMAGGGSLGSFSTPGGEVIRVAWRTEANALWFRDLSNPAAAWVPLGSYRLHGDILRVQLTDGTGMSFRRAE